MWMNTRKYTVIPRLGMYVGRKVMLLNRYPPDVYSSEKCSKYAIFTCSLEVDYLL